ncbi:MAG: glycosyl hydrolase family 28-related protein [Armatimonadota bacterium]
MSRILFSSIIIGISICGMLTLSIEASADTLSVKKYGAKADGKTDDTAAFQKALNSAAKKHGSTVYAPIGRYLIAGTITVPINTTLKGDYPGQGRQRGTILLSTTGKGKADGPGCIVLTAASGLKGIAFEYPEQSPDAKVPVLYPYTITAGPDSRIEDIFLFNSYQGINLDSSHGNLVRNVWGEPLKIGINADHIYDISRIENVHFWPYFSLGKPMRTWVQQNGTAFQFGRSDWQYCINTFCFGYHTGYRFYQSKEIKEKNYPGGQTNGNFVGIGADSVVYGIDVEDSFSIGISITNGEFAPFGSADSRGVILRKGNTGNLTLVNCNFWAVAASAVEVQSGSLNLSSCNIQHWGLLDKSAPCFVAGGGRLNVNGCTFNSGGSLAILDGAETRALFTGNMGTEPLKIVSHIGDRLMFGTNNPKIDAVD